MKGLRLLPGLLVVLAGCVWVVGSTGAAGASGRPLIVGYPYGRQCPGAGYADRVDRWAMNTCNCTSYVAWALEANGRRVDWFEPGEMDAHNWPRVARGAGIPVGTAAKVAAVAVWPRVTPPWGHVGFVTAVHADGTFDVAEYNLRRRFRFDVRYRVSPAGAVFVYVPSR